MLIFLKHRCCVCINCLWHLNNSMLRFLWECLYIFTQKYIYTYLAECCVSREIFWGFFHEVSCLCLPEKLRKKNMEKFSQFPKHDANALSM